MGWKIQICLVLLAFLTLIGGWADVLSLPRPEGLKAVAEVETQVTLTWLPVSGAEGYRIYRQSLRGPWIRVQEIEGQTYFEDADLQDGFSYTYAVSAFGSGGEGPRSAVVTVQTKASQVKKLEAMAGDGQIVLTWDPSPGALGYNIYRDTFFGPSGPSVFQLVGQGQAGTFTDRGVVNGTRYFYQVIPVNFRGESSFSAFTPAANATPLGPGTTLKGTGPEGGQEPGADVPALAAEAGNRQIFLHWTSTGSGWALYRSAGSGPEILLNSGLVSRTYLDIDVVNGTTYRYRVQTLGTPGPGPLSQPAVGSPSGADPKPWSGTLRYGLSDEPSQEAGLWIPDLGKPVQGVLVLNGLGLRDVPRLSKVAGGFNLAVLELNPFNFGTPGKPRYLKTRWDETHGLMPVDIRWPSLSSDRLQAALDALARQVPGHPECAGVGVVSYGVSLLSWANSSTLSQPAWRHRILAMVGLSDMDDHRLNLVESVPHLFVASGKSDWFSNLYAKLPVVPKGPWPNLIFPWALDESWTQDSYCRSLSTDRGAPLTVLNNLEAGHAGNPDNPFISVWLADILSQRIPPVTQTTGKVVLPDWNSAAGYVGSYDLETYAGDLWTLVTQPSVRLTHLTVSPKVGYRGSRPFTWLPSRNTALAWKAYSENGL